MIIVSLFLTTSKFRCFLLIYEQAELMKCSSTFQFIITKWNVRCFSLDDVFASRVTYLRHPTLHTCKCITGLNEPLISITQTSFYILKEKNLNSSIEYRNDNDWYDRNIVKKSTYQALSDFAAFWNEIEPSHVMNGEWNHI